MREAKVIPVCFGGLTIDRLPKPYSSLQAVEIETHQGAYYLFSSIAHHLGIDLPKKPIFSDELPAYWTEQQKEEDRSLFHRYKSLISMLNIIWKIIDSNRDSGS